MERANKVDPLEVLPDVPINSIAHKAGISSGGVEGSAKRLGVEVIRTATGRAAVKPRDAVRIIQELQAKQAAHS
jgi:hypothetical protein